MVYTAHEPGVFFTVLTTSSAAGMAISLVYYYAESIVVAVFLSISTWSETVASYMLGRNASALMTAGDRTLGINFAIGGTFGTYPSALHAFLVLTAYTLALGSLAVSTKGPDRQLTAGNYYWPGA